MICMFKRYYVFVTMMTLTLMVVSAGTTYANINIDQTRTIDLNKFYEIPMTEVKAGDVLSLDIQVTSGGPIDVLLMKSSDYPGYLNAIAQRGTFNYIEEASIKGITSQKNSYRFKEKGDYYLVIDNTDVPDGGGSPLDQVDINLKVSVVTPAPTEPPKISGFEVILAVFVIFALAYRK